MIVLDDISLRVAGRLLIDHASVSIPEGAHVGVVGRNGCGKTTLFRAIENEVDIETGSIHKPARARIGRVAHFVRDRMAAAEPGGDPVRQRMPRMVRTARTFPALVPWLRMDRIYTRGFEVRSAHVLGGAEWAKLSDHSPLIADLTLKS